jgi:hypothetical protein
MKIEHDPKLCVQPEISGDMCDCPCSECLSLDDSRQFACLCQSCPCLTIF